jgi:hypothetical protein
MEKLTEIDQSVYICTVIETGMHIVQNYDCDFISECVC